MPHQQPLQSALNRARNAMGRSRASRLLSAKMLYSKLLELRAKAVRRAIHVRARTFWNAPMTVTFPDQVSMMIYRYGLFEEDVASIFLARLGTGAVVLDVGAHIGFFSLLASELVGDTGQVHSFEPTPSTFEVLKQNVGSHANVQAHNVAAFSQETTVSFRDFGVAFPAFNTVYGGRLDEETRQRASAKTYDVSAISLDAFARRNNLHPTFVKVDAEGAEFDILQGMPEILRRDRPDVVLEVGDKGAGAGASSAKIIDHIRGFAYRGFEWTQGSFIEHKPAERFAHANLLFIAQEKCDSIESTAR